MKSSFPVILLFLMAFHSAQLPLSGAWEYHDAQSIQTRIYADGFFSVSIYSLDGKQFVDTYGGKYSASAERITEIIEFDTRNPERIGITEASTYTATKEEFTHSSLPGITFNRIDDGDPGKLAGAWLITGRVNEKGEIRRSTPGARRTMKILSGTRFQWIAYNVDTKEFFGTGGGTYTTVDGKYTETISFFSRDNTRVGVALGFAYSIEEGDWHHKGLSSKGEPINEIWTKREKLGI